MENSVCETPTPAQRPLRAADSEAAELDSKSKDAEQLPSLKKSSNPKKSQQLLSPIEKPSKSVGPQQLTPSAKSSDPLRSSSVLLTPESSPVKEKDHVSVNGGGSPVDVDHSYARSDRHVPPVSGATHCKQLTVANETAASPQSSVPKKRRGRRGKAKSATAEKSDAPGRTKPGRRKKTQPELHNTSITDYFPVRRSGRKTSTTIKKEQTEELEEKILSHCEDGLKIVDLEGKGRGVVASAHFQKGDFVVEYAGDLIDMDEAKRKEERYSTDSNIGCYMYYFIHKCKQYCIDATSESGKLGRLLNHSRNGNCHTKVVQIGKRPHLILVASQEIAEGEELLYDYGDRSKSSIESHPWLKS